MPVRLNGSTSGYVELAAPAVAGTTSLELPTDSIKPGLVLVAAESFSAVSSVSVNNCFTATYENYRITMRVEQSNAADAQFRVRVGGVDLTTATYSDGSIFNSFTTSLGAGGGTGKTFIYLATTTAGGSAYIAYDVLSPQAAQNTGVVIGGVNSASAGFTAGRVNNTTSYDGFTVYPSAGTFTGSLRIYGLRNSL